eukprot:SAG22_NODE_3987_length_1435_cov_3.305389_1_plen_323_part_00
MALVPATLVTLLLTGGLLCLGTPAAASSGWGPGTKPDYQSPELTPWPKPRSFTNGSGWLLLDVPAGATSPLIGGGSTASKSQLLADAMARAAGDISLHSPASPFAQAPAGARRLPGIHLLVVVRSDSEALDAGTDESYVLDVDEARGARIVAPTVFGALRGLASLAQLFEAAPGLPPPPAAGGATDKFVLRGLPWHISDAPRFEHRAMLLDTSRHWLPPAALQAHIDAMAYNKLNVLHWHIVDFQAFPFASTAMPALVRGAYSLHEVYTPAQVRAVVKYAKDRGVRTIMEVDTPGHAASWAAGYPETVAACPVALAASQGEE